MPAFYPLVDRPIALDLPTTDHSLGPTALLWVGCLLVLYRRALVGRYPERAGGNGR